MTKQPQLQMYVDRMQEIVRRLSAVEKVLNGKTKFLAPHNTDLLLATLDQQHGTRSSHLSVLAAKTACRCYRLPVRSITACPQTQPPYRFS